MEPAFVQEPPSLDNQYRADRVLQSYVQRHLPQAILDDIRPDLEEVGALAAGELYELQQADLGAEPTLTRWGPWGRRIDRIELTNVWKRAETLAAERGIVATAYEQEHGRYSRVHQMALAYLFIPSTDMYGCPLAMTDGAAHVLLDSDDETIADEAVPHLTSRDPDTFWTSGQWMTELAGGSDVGRAQTTARKTNGSWRLYGRKWFTSAITANVALALARPDGNPEGGKGLALFYVPIRDGGDLRDGISVNRLKEKLGTRKLPTAELSLDGALARPVTEERRNGTRHIAPMLNVTRTWNAVTAASLIRRGIALARDYARKREAFGRRIIDHGLHQETLADISSTLEGCFHLSFRTVRLLGALETDEASDLEQALLRLLTPITKLTTARQAVSATSEVVEAFGGAGYVEDTGIPPLLRDAQVLTIWEGTTNVLGLDLLRAIREVGLEPLRHEVARCAEAVEIPPLMSPVQSAQRAVREACTWLESVEDEERRRRGARRVALTLGQCLQVLYTARHAQWALREEEDVRSAAAAERLASRRINRMSDLDRRGSRALAYDRASDDAFEVYAGGGGSSPE